MTFARHLLALALLSGLAWPAAAQLSPQPGVLTLPKKHSAGAPAAPVTPPQSAPVQPVQQVAPFASSPPPTAPAKPYVPAPGAPARPAVAHKPKHPTPVVQAPPNVHAQRAPATTAKPVPTAAKPTATAPAGAAPEPVVGAATGKPLETIGSNTKLPLPRWASLRADEVNLRVGPGMRFPIDWQYHRRDLPVRILREVEVWRLVEDQDGVKGWVHSATLIGRRGFVVKAAEATIRAAAADDSTPVARLKPGVVGRIRACGAGAAWCEVQAGSYKGWLRRDQFYGTDPGEAVTP